MHINLPTESLLSPFQLFMDFPGGASGKEHACHTGIIRDVGSIPGSGRSPGGRPWQTTPVLLPKESHGQRILAGYNPWGHRESDTTEVA